MIEDIGNWLFWIGFPIGICAVMGWLMSGSIVGLIVGVLVGILLVIIMFRFINFSDLKNENEALRERVKKLEKKLREFK